MSKIRMSYEEKLAAEERYQCGEASLAQIATDIRVKKSAIGDWLHKYETFGSGGLKHSKQNQCFDTAHVQSGQMY